MLDKVLVFIGASVDPDTEKEWDALLEASGYQAFFAAREWTDVDAEGCLTRAEAVRSHLKAYFDTGEAVYVDQPQKIQRYGANLLKRTGQDVMTMLPMPDSPYQLLDALDALFANA